MPLALFLARFFALPGILLLLTGCGTARFYTQAIRGQWEMSSSKVSVTKLLQDPATPDPLRRQFKLTQEIRAFAAKEVGLPIHGQYDTYADLKRKQVSWVVFAAPEFSIEGKSWWYPILGNLDYRGYFDEADARQFAAQLKADGFDVTVGEVGAYSTLGYLRDPLLNTFINDPAPDLAELLFHELTHQKLYLSGETDFNEALATMVGQEATRRWLKSSGRLAELRSYEQSLREIEIFVREVQSTRRELDAFYKTSLTATLEARRKGKAAILQKLRNRCDVMPALKRRAGFGRWLAKPLNNARLNTISTYYDLIPAFRAVLTRENGDFGRLFAVLEKEGVAAISEKKMTQPSKDR